MTKTIAFPTPTATANHKSQANQIITIASAVASFPLGGPGSYTDIRAWKRDNAKKEAPYSSVVIEFSANVVMTIGDGDEAIGLFGEIEGVGKFLLGVLGVGLGNALPQIPIITPIVGPSDGGVGFAQVVCNVAAYDRLAIGGVTGAIAFSGDTPTVTVRARPLRVKDFVG